jgi:hypothetical protein
MGCDKKISLDFKHNPRISDSVSCTFFPGREPRTKMKAMNETKLNKYKLNDNHQASIEI